MKRSFRKIRLAAVLLVLPLLAQALMTPVQIERAIEDGLVDLAEQQIWEQLSTDQTPDEEATLTLLLMRALAGRQAWEQAVILAEESSHLPQQEAFTYWKARILFEAGRFQEVFPTLETLPADSRLQPAALRLEGRAARETNDLRRAESAFTRFRDRFDAHPDAPQNLFDLAEVQLARGRRQEAAGTLSTLLARFPENTLADAARLLLARELMDGPPDDMERVTVLLRSLGESDSAHPRLRIAAWVELAAVMQRLNRPAEAANALQQAETLTGETTLVIRQKTARATLLAEEGSAEEAFALFNEVIQSAPNTEIAAEALIRKAEALLRSERFSDAARAFQAYLDVTADPEQQARALVGKGWSLWEQQLFEEAADAFEAAASKTVQTNRMVQARIKAGDARLAAGQVRLAVADYQYVMENAPGHPLAPQSLYQLGAATLQTGDTDAAREYFQRVEADFPQSPFAPQAALQQARLLKNDQRWSEALDEYRRVDTGYTNAAARAAANREQGLILYRLGRWDDALKAFRAVQENRPDSPDASQAFYMIGFCRYLQGDIEDAIAICREFIERYPDSEWHPEVLFWLAEHYYNRGEYTQARDTFLNIQSGHPKHELADDALYWAGAAQLQQDEYLDAFNLFSRFAKLFPDSALMLQARFAQGEALTELGEFPRAILAYEEVIKNAPDDLLADRARGRRADCLFILGAEDSARYREALEAFEALSRRPSLPFALRLQALYKVSRCAEALDLPDRALEYRMTAVYSTLDQTAPLPPGAVVWFTRAAFDAAAAQEQKQQWAEAARIYQRVIDARVPARTEARKRMEKIKREHASAF